MAGNPRWIKGVAQTALLNDPDIARAMEMRRSGARLREIAAELAVHPGTVSKLLTGRTFGGKGKVADPQPRGRHRRSGQS